MATLREELEQEKMRMLSIVAFGCNRAAQKQFSKLVEEPFVYYEYFLSKPILRQYTDEKAKNTAIYALFLERVLQQFQFAPGTYETSANLKRLPDNLTNNSELKQNNVTYDSIKHLLIFSGVMSDEQKSRLNNLSTDPSYQDAIEVLFYSSRSILNVKNIDSYLNGSRGNIQYVPISRHAIKKFLPGPVKLSRFGDSILSWTEYKKWKDNNTGQSKLEKLSDLKDLPKGFIKRKTADDKIAAFTDFLITCAPYCLHNIPDLYYLCCPIASQEVFYGTLIFAHPDFKVLQKVQETKVRKVRKVQLNVLEYLSHNIYLPVLTLFENYWEEFVLEKGLKEGLEQKGSVAQGKQEIRWRVSKWYKDKNEVVVSRVGKNSQEASLRLIFLLVKNNFRTLNTLEKRLNSIWEVRSELLNIGDKKNKEKLKSHLLFANYNVASPAMLKLVEKIANLNLKKFDKSLPSALVIGGPGSGKDTLARLIALFSGEYSKGEIILMNMASYKPEAISTPLLSGLNIEKMKINGLFSQLPEGATLILDELNSLDMDAQGALLRILENGEMVPLGTIKPIRKDLNVLVVGVMNEDPEKLTKESTLRQILTQERLFGGALGEVLYEYVRSTRRLREDLYYRFIRGGKFVVPELDGRREDIPILFYVYAKGFAGGYKVTVDFDAYDVLMSEAINWPGNIRQLQTLVKEVVDKTLGLGVDPKKGLDITAKDVEGVLKEMKMLKVENEEYEMDEVRGLEKEQA